MWPTSGPGGYITHAVLGVPDASMLGTKSEVAHNWASGYITPAVWGVPYASKRGTKSDVAHKWAGWLHNPSHLGSPMLQSRDKIRCGPQMGPVAT